MVKTLNVIFERLFIHCVNLNTSHREAEQDKICLNFRHSCKMMQVLMHDYLDLLVLLDGSRYRVSLLHLKREEATLSDCILEQLRGVCLGEKSRNLVSFLPVSTHKSFSHSLSSTQLKAHYKRDRRE